MNVQELEAVALSHAELAEASRHALASIKDSTWRAEVRANMTAHQTACAAWMVEAGRIAEAERLTAEAQALVERLEAAACDAIQARDFTEAGRIGTINRQARQRWMRRLDKWAVAAYGPGVK